MNLRIEQIRLDGGTPPVLDPVVLAEWTDLIRTGDDSRISPRSIFTDCTLISRAEDLEWIERVCERNGAIALIDPDPVRPGGWVFHSMWAGNRLHEKPCAGRFRGSLASNGAKTLLGRRQAESVVKSAKVRHSQKLKLSGTKVYFIQAETGGPIKIGWAACVTSRVRDIQAMNPAPLRLLATVDGGRDRESGLHKKFAHIRQHGEWFEPAADLLAFITSIGEK